MHKFILAFVPLATARITGIAVPTTILPGDPFDVIIRSSNYIQTVYDVAIAFGYTPGDGYPDTLGVAIASEYLGPEKSNKQNDFNVTVTIPADAERGRALVGGSLMSLYGASSSPTLSNYNVSVVLGDETALTYSSSQ